jgi:hypothetical protein
MVELTTAFTDISLSGYFADVPEPDTMGNTEADEPLLHAIGAGAIFYRFDAQVPSAQAHLCEIALINNAEPQAICAASSNAPALDEHQPSTQ